MHLDELLWYPRAIWQERFPKRDIAILVKKCLDLV